MSKQVVGVTGPHGFIAGHLLRRLAHNEKLRVLACSRETFEDSEALALFVKRCDTIVHLAAVNRGDDDELYQKNISLVDRLIAAIEVSQHSPHIIFSSSTQSALNNAYGRSKKYGEDQLAAWVVDAERRSATVFVVPNVFGPGCRPFYNSVVATFCHQLAQGEQPQVLQDKEVEFLWINDLVDSLCQAIEQSQVGFHVERLVGSTELKVSELLAKLQGYRDSQAIKNYVPDLSNPLDARLYATYLSYLDLSAHCHRPEVHRDNRGQLFEIIRMANGGQVFFSTTKPGVVRGNHFHTRKLEWFCVLQGDAAIRLRRVDDKQVHEFQVSGDAPQFVSIPLLYTHQIENVGKEDLLTMFWSSEIFSADDADTYMEKVA